jgi:membrane carboxypeptidase/penicillin-binding protein
MMKALAGHPNVPFEAPEGVSFVEIDRDTGRLAHPHLPAGHHRSVPRRHRTLEYSAHCTAGNEPPCTPYNPL